MCPAPIKHSYTRSIHLPLLIKIHNRRATKVEKKPLQMWMVSEQPPPSTLHIVCHTFPSSPRTATRMFRGQRPHLPRLTCLSHRTLRCVCLTVCDALRVPVPPSAKLNLSSPSSAHWERPSSHPQRKHCERRSGECSKPPLPKAQCNCPVIVHSSTAQRVEEGGGSKELWALYIQDIVIWQWASY